MRKKVSDEDCLDGNILDILQYSSDNDSEFERNVVSFEQLNVNDENHPTMSQPTYHQAESNLIKTTSVLTPSKNSKKIETLNISGKSVEKVIKSLINYDDIQSSFNMNELKSQIRYLVTSEKGSKCLQSNISKFHQGSILFIYNTVSLLITYSR